MDAFVKCESNISPFDQIKQVDTDGREYWLARDLMPILGYQQWRQFSDAISRAIAACKNMGHESEKHFLRLTAKSTGGRPPEDFKLSRYGSYLTAMNGDPRKSEIAAAQNYFAVKTRSAELAPQTQELLSQLLERLEQQNQVISEQGKALAQLQSQVQNLLPVSADFIPPGWNEEVWQKLPPQDKRHFRFLYRRRRFRPSHQGKDEPLALPWVTTDLRFNELKNGEPFLDNSTSPVIHRGGGTAPKRALCKGSPFLRGENCEQVKQRQQAELHQVLGEVPQEEKQRLEAAKQELLKRFWAEGEQ